MLLTRPCPLVARGAARSALAALALGLALAGCGGAGQLPDPPAAVGRCDPARIEACEQAISAALDQGGVRRELLAAYADAREARAAGDPWAKLLRALGAGGVAAASPAAEAARAAVIVEGDGPRARGGAAGAAGAAPTWIRVATLPAPAAIDAEALLLAAGEAGGYGLLVHVRRGEALELFPRDPLAPFTAGVPPIARGDAALAHVDRTPSRSEGSVASIVDADAEIAALVRRAFDAGARFRYVDAAAAADALAAAVRGRDPNAEPVLRGRYALRLLAAAGLSLEEEEGAPAADAEARDAPPAAGDTPYGDLLRIRTARDERAAWKARGASVLSAVAADRREALSALLGGPPGCAAAPPPPMDDVRDLPFAPRLAAALPSGAAGALPLKAWLGRYEALVAAVDRTGTLWAYAPSVLYARGAALGMSPAGTATYRRVTELGLAHLRGLSQLAEASPRRYRALSQIPLAYSPGLLEDDRLRDAFVDLTRVTVQRKLAAARDAGAVFDAVVAGLFAGMSYPPAVQKAHFVALQGALTAKLRGDLTRSSGWGTAGLYAADALYRVIADQRPDLGASSAQIARALSTDPTTPYPALAALAVSLSRYAALGFDRKLDAGVTDARRFPPERREALSALRDALAGLAAEGERPPRALLDDIATLADGLIAVLSSELGRPPPAPGTCAADAARLDPVARRALGKLGDVRRRILASPRYRRGDDAWARRARLVVTLLSDAMDLAAEERRAAGGAGAPALRFTVPAADAEAAFAGALRGWEEPALAEALAGAHALARSVLEAPSAAALSARSAAPLRRVLAGLGGFFRKDAGEGSAGVAMLDALATMPMDAARAGDLGGLLLGYAAAFSTRGQRDQADLWLLCSLLAAALADGAPSPEAVALAEQNGGRVAWALRYLAEVDKARRGVAPDPAAYAASMRAAADDACQKPDPTDVIAVMAAVRGFAAGERTSAREALDRVLDAADARGLHVPRMTYRYEEKTATRVLSLSFDISFGAGVLEGAKTFQLGLGLRSRGEPEGSMTATLTPPDATRAGDDAARYYIHTAALAAAYHYLEGDAERGAAAARRAIGALSFGVRLGARAVASDRPLAWGRDAKALLALDAQLAAEAGQPFLAGDLWTVTRALLEADADDAAVAAALDPLPAGVAVVEDIRPIAARAARSLSVVAGPLPCTEAAPELGGYEEPACDAYPLALSLRVADALKKLPRLRRAGSAAKCGALRRLDAFLAAADKGTYDPDAFTGALEALRAEGRRVEAGLLLSRHRRAGHCNPAIVGAARSLGRATPLDPALRSDLLSVAVNCASTSLDEAVLDDLLSLDAQTRLLPDLGRNLKLVLFVAGLSLREDRFDLLARLTAQPDFVGRWMRVSPEAATAALLLDHAAAALSPGPGASAAAPGRRPEGSAYELLCETLPPGDRVGVCASIKALRDPGATPEARRRAAREALAGLVDEAGRGGPPGP